MWNEIAVDWCSVAMWVGTFISLSVRMRTLGLVRPLFVTQSTWFGILDFLNVEGEWV